VCHLVVAAQNARMRARYEIPVLCWAFPVAVRVWLLPERGAFRDRQPGAVTQADSGLNRREWAKLMGALGPD
jgi:hypothetical protein